MNKLVLILLIYVISLLLLNACSKDLPKEIQKPQAVVKISEPAPASCTEQLIKDLGYTQERYTELIMECNILKIQSLDAAVRRIKGQRRVEIVYLNVKCDEIAQTISQYNTECNNRLTASY